MQIKKKYGMNISSQKIEGIILEQVSKIKENKKNKTSYVIWKITLFDSDLAKKIANIFIPLLRMNLCLFLILISILIHTYYIIYNPVAADFSGNWLLVYLFIVLLGIFHEFGHAAAAVKYNSNIGVVGFGFFLIFPVFFSDVTRIWLLNRKQRFFVNISGVYFQVLFSTLVVFLNILIPSLNATFNKILYANYFMIILAINPYMRNDGYWVISDLFSIPNMVKESYLFPVSIFTGGIKKFSFVQIVVLSVYSLGLYFLILIFICYLFKMLPGDIKLVEKIYSSDLNTLQIIKNNWEMLFKLVMRYLLLCSILINWVKRICKMSNI